MNESSKQLEEISAKQPSSRRGLLGVVASLAALAGVGVAWWRYTPQPVATDAVEKFWQLTLESPSGEKVLLRNFKGKPILLNFWATWCPPCVEELPLLDRFYLENKANGWQVVGIAVDKQDAVVRFLGKMPLQFPVLLAGFSGIELAKSMGDLSGGLPFTVVIGSDGLIAQRKMGQVKTDDLTSWVSLK